MSMYICMSRAFLELEIELENGDKMGLGRTPGYARYSGYDTEEDEDEFLSVLGPVWRDGDPIPAEDLEPRKERKSAGGAA
jgi:hypothetical protein